MKNTSLNNREYSSSPMGSLDSICLQMADNLSYTRSRSDYDKKQLHELKQEFSKVFNDLIANKKIVDLYLEGYGYLYGEKLTMDTHAVVMMKIYTILKSYYTDTTLFASLSGHIYKKEMIDVLTHEETPNLDDDMHVETLYKQKNVDRDVDDTIDDDMDELVIVWNEIGGRLHIDDLSEENCYELCNTLDWDSYNPQELSDLALYLKRKLRSIKISRQSEIKDFIAFISRELQEYIDSRSALLSKENAKNMVNITTIAFISGIHVFDEFVRWVRDYIAHTTNFTNFASFEDLQGDSKHYALFLQFRHAFVEQYTTHVFDAYTTLFKHDPALDKFYYTNILVHIQNLGAMYTPSKMSDKQFFLGLKRNFLLGDVYEFLEKNITKENFDDIVFSPFLSKEIKKYSRK